MPKLTEACINEINRAEPLKNYLTPAAGYSKEYACPICGSKHHVKIFEKNNDATCMKCRAYIDLITAKREKEGTDFPTAAKEIAEKNFIRLEFEGGADDGDFAPPEGWKAWSEKRRKAREKEEGIATEDEPAPKEEKTEDLIKDPPEAPEIKPNTPGKFKDKIAQWTADAGPAREYMKTRGPFTDSFLDIYEIGYNPAVNFYDKEKKTYFKAPAVIFSYNVEYSYYSAHALTGHYFRQPNTDEAGSEPLYRPEQLKEEVCFVVESQIDALSIIQSGAPAVALCGFVYNRLLPEIEGRKTPLILFLDNDATGKEKQPELIEELKKRGIPYREARFDYSKYKKPTKDANDLFKSNPEQFKKDIAANVAAVLDPTGIESFLFETQTEKFKPIPTGIKSIDKLLFGGFMPGTLILLGSPPGGGKTALATQVFESMAENGKPGIVINLEMSQEQLIARSLARRVYIRNPHYKLKSLEILRGYKLSEDSKRFVKEAAEEYKEKIGPRLLYNPAGVGPDLDEIIKYINDIADRAQREGKQPPNICIDYLHLLTGRQGEDTASILKRAVFAFKEYAIRYNAIAFCIEAQNRTANEKKEAVMEAGRDSSGLEYSGDLILQLVRKDPDKHPEEVNLCITKSRFTETNFSGDKYILHGAQSYLIAADEEEKKKKKQTEEFKTVDPKETPFN